MEVHSDDQLKKIAYESSKIFYLFGLTSTEAHVFSYLYITKQPHSLDELSEALGKSKSSIHTGIRNLTSKNLVLRVWKKGVRKGIYEAQDDIYKTMMQMMTTEWLETIKFQLSSLNELQEQLYDEDNQRTLQTTQQRLDEFITFHEQLQHTCSQKAQSL